MRKPDFFLVGAPRCGTTALHRYLAGNPQVYMTAVKEPYYFAPELVRPPLEMDEREYLGLFAEAGDALRVGEASPGYLYSEAAPLRIREFAPEARILINLRSPVDMIRSLHAQLLAMADEEIPDLETALEAEAARSKGERIPRGCKYPLFLRYREVTRFHDRVQRYFELFGRERVHVTLFDDLKRDARESYRAVCRFLELPDDSEAQFEVVNPSRRVRWPALQQFLRRSPEGFLRVARLVPRPLRRAVHQRLWSANLAANKQAAPTNDGLRLRLAEELRPEVERLGELLRRDLTHWSHVR